MARPRISLLAVGSVVLNLPWVAALVWVLEMFVHRKGPIAGEIFLLPIICYIPLSLFAAMMGLTSLSWIRQNPDHLRGRWIAYSGMFLTALGPLMALWIDNGFLPLLPHWPRE